MLEKIRGNPFFKIKNLFYLYIKSILTILTMKNTHYLYLSFSLLLATTLTGPLSASIEKNTSPNTESYNQGIEITVHSEIDEDAVSEQQNYENIIKSRSTSPALSEHASDHARKVIERIKTGIDNEANERYRGCWDRLFCTSDGRCIRAMKEGAGIPAIEEESPKYACWVSGLFPTTKILGGLAGAFFALSTIEGNFFSISSQQSSLLISSFYILFEAFNQILDQQMEVAIEKLAAICVQRTQKKEKKEQNILMTLGKIFEDSEKEHLSCVLFCCNQDIGLEEFFLIKLHARQEVIVAAFQLICLIGSLVISSNNISNISEDQYDLFGLLFFAYLSFSDIIVNFYEGYHMHRREELEKILTTAVLMKMKGRGMNEENMSHLLL